MDAFLTFLSNYYIWFLVAAGIFLFALIGLIIESSKKRKKDMETSESEEVGTVESFRRGDNTENVSSSDTNIDTNQELSSSESDNGPILDLGVTPSLEDNSTFDTPNVESNNVSSSDNNISFETPSFEVTDDNDIQSDNVNAIEQEPIEENNEKTFETPSFEDSVDTVSTVEEIPAPETPSFEIVDDVVDTDSLDTPEEQNETTEQPAPVDNIMDVPSLEDVPAFESVDMIEEKNE